MYLAAHIPQRYTPRVRRRLGDSTAGQVASSLVPDWLKTAFNYWTFQPNWTDPNAPFVWTPSQYAAAQASPPPTQPSDSYVDLAMNALTGKATTTQIQSNIDSCVQSIQRMRQLAAANPGTVAAPPAGAEAQCTTDQASFMAAAVSPSNLLKNVIPSNTALYVVLAIAAGIGLWAWSRR